MVKEDETCLQFTHWLKSWRWLVPADPLSQVLALACVPADLGGEYLK